MKTRIFSTGILWVLLLSLSGCFGSDFTDDFDKLKKNATDPSGSSTSCPIGTWKTPTCSASSGKYLLYNFGSNGEGYSSNPECTGLCSGPLKFYFRYTKTSSTINYTFYKTDPVTCNGTTSSPGVPTGNYTITYTCGNNGNQLTTEATSTQTGVRTTLVFTRL